MRKRPPRAQSRGKKTERDDQENIERGEEVKKRPKKGECERMEEMRKDVSASRTGVKVRHVERVRENMRECAI